MIYRVFQDMHAFDASTIEGCYEHIKFFDDYVEWRTEATGPKGNYVHHFGCNNKDRPFIRRDWLIVELPDDHNLCKSCLGIGYILHFYERGGNSPPGNMYMGCDDCPEGQENTIADLAERYGRDKALEYVKMLKEKKEQAQP